MNTKTTNHIYNDGGRLAAGYKGHTGDCVVRAIAITCELPYQQVYSDLCALNAAEFNRRRATKSRLKAGTRKANGNTARYGTSVDVMKKYLAPLGWKWLPTMSIGGGCKVHLQADELPKGRIIARLSKHVCAVIDGVINDTYNPNERGVTTDAFGNDITTNRCVYGYFYKPTEGGSNDK